MTNIFGCSSPCVIFMESGSVTSQLLSSSACPVEQFVTRLSTTHRLLAGGGYCIVSDSMFRVVSFRDAREVAVISSRWWRTAKGQEEEKQPIGHTYWPPKDIGRSRGKLFNNGGCAPDPATWSYHPARSLLKTDDIREANEVLNSRAIYTSDVASGREEEDRERRVRRTFSNAKQTADSRRSCSSDSNEEDQPSLPTPPPVPDTLCRPVPKARRLDVAENCGSRSASVTPRSQSQSVAQQTPRRIVPRARSPLQDVHRTLDVPLNCDSESESVTPRSQSHSMAQTTPRRTVPRARSPLQDVQRTLDVAVNCGSRSASVTPRSQSHSVAQQTPRRTVPRARSPLQECENLNNARADTAEVPISRSEYRRLNVVLARIVTKLDALERGQRDIKEAQRASGTAVDQRQPVLKRLRTVEEFEQLEELLGRTRGAKTAMKDQLSRWCTLDLRTSVRQMMPALFAPELARRLSLKGQNQKKGLADTNIFDLVADILHTSWGATRSDISRRISVWLSGARDRRSGPEPARKKRAAGPRNPVAAEATAESETAEDVAETADDVGAETADAGSETAEDVAEAETADVGAETAADDVADAETAEDVDDLGVPAQVEQLPFDMY